MIRLIQIGLNDICVFFPEKNTSYFFSQNFFLGNISNLGVFFKKNISNIFFKKNKVTIFSTPDKRIYFVIITSGIITIGNERGENTHTMKYT